MSREVCGQTLPMPGLASSSFDARIASMRGPRGSGTPSSRAGPRSPVAARRSAGASSGIALSSEAAALNAGRTLDDALVEELSQRAHKQCHPLENIIVDPDWRRAMVPVYVKRVLSSLRA